MPIRPELREHYGRNWRKVIRPRILARAEYCCEQCGVPDRVKVRRWRGMWVDPDYLTWRADNGAMLFVEDPPLYSQIREVRIVLTVAHINHQPGDDRDENLLALCQWCHLNMDRDANRETLIDRRDAERRLLLPEERENQCVAL